MFQMFDKLNILVFLYCYFFIYFKNFIKFDPVLNLKNLFISIYIFQSAIKSGERIFLISRELSYSYLKIFIKEMSFSRGNKEYHQLCLIASNTLYSNANGYRPGFTCLSRVIPDDDDE